MFKSNQNHTPQANPGSFCSPTFDQYAITLPEDSAPLLKNRVFTVLAHKLYDVYCPHDMSACLLINLHDLLSADQCDDELHDQEHLLLLDQLQLSVLKRFCQTERRLAGQHRPRMTQLMSNYGYWRLLGELLDHCTQACRLGELSFFA